MYYIARYNLRLGDRIVQGIYAVGDIKHFAIYLGFINGIECVAENHKFYGVRIVTADYYFSASNDTFYIQQFSGTAQERAQMVHRALALNGTPYNLFLFNCEHYANYVQYGKAESPQVKKVLGVGLGIALAIALFKS